VVYDANASSKLNLVVAFAFKIATLMEMVRGKKYDDRLLFFQEAFNWIMDNIIVITPQMGISNTEASYNDESLENNSRLIQTFDTGVTEFKTRAITTEEMSKIIPTEVVQGIFNQIMIQKRVTGAPGVQVTWRV